MITLAFDFAESILNYIRTPVTDNISYVEEDNSTKVINGIGEPVLSFVRCFKDTLTSQGCKCDFRVRIDL